MRPMFAAVALMMLAAPLEAVAAPTVAEVIEHAPTSDWVAFDQSDLLYLTLADGGRVVIALAPAFAPRHVANIKALVKARWFDHTAVTRVQDNYVAQWGDPARSGPPSSTSSPQRLPAGIAPKLSPEWERPLAGLATTTVPGADGYAPAAAYTGAAWPIAIDPAHGRAWLTHCYAMVGVGRDNAADSGNGAELYAVIGATPRGLDRNVTLVGRVIDGIERLSSLPRGTGALGFYEQPSQNVPVRSVRLGTELLPAEQIHLETLRAGTPSFAALVAARATRAEPFFVTPTGHVDLCNVRPPIRRTSN